MEASSRPAKPRWLIWTIIGVAVVVLAGLFWLFRPGGEEANAPVDVFDLPTMDGTLVIVEPPRLVMRPFKPVDGQQEVEFTIRDKDKGNFDIAHLRSHFLDRSADAAVLPRGGRQALRRLQDRRARELAS